MINRKLLSSWVLVVGMGGIGSNLLLFLAASGVGRITVVDHDDVEVSNLHWQVIYTKGGRGTSKIIVLEYAWENDQTDQISRYPRQLLLLDGFGVLGQRKLLSSSVLVVGAGGIGSNRLLFLATISVGCITVVYHDKQKEHKVSDAVHIRSTTENQQKDFMRMDYQ